MAFRRGLFFNRFYHCCRTDFQDSCGVSNAATVHHHIRNLLFDLWEISSVAIVKNKSLPRTIRITTLVALLSFTRLTILNDIIALTAGTKNWFEYHRSNPDSYECFLILTDQHFWNTTVIYSSTRDYRQN